MTRSQVSQQSLEAFRRLKETGRLNEEQQFVYQKLQQYGPCTGKELHKKLVIVENNRRSKIEGPERVRKRLPELADEGVVRRKKKRKCNVTDRTATVWEVKQ